MSEDSPVEMDEEERDAFLGDGGTGVISLSTAADEPPHAVPVSYGYDATEATFYFRLADGDEGAKGDLEGRPVTFVTYGEEEGWRSVVARGRLEGVRSEGIATETLEGLDRVDIPLVDIFHAPLREVAFEFYRLVPDELTGRVESEYTVT
ncbi:pyridoxamine 5'-phosphate oxidase family protein [Halorarum salinum]|uniref:Pyridoxamine 5'-phosphate oxidase family protein n=1 Tax=Halorarum salinum TaxID=2743089 RepID=A0A7D5LA87_9EURY|nr:pyridoxamine 5'-phosphate oxidase family protein [Halobaculum salinum]QLG61853.1 pyridoxamine 5'-phosphate oxidase family protein [Halobaculum salinum]